jgi:hypothetical protein
MGRLSENRNQHTQEQAPGYVDSIKEYVVGLIPQTKFLPGSFRSKLRGIKPTHTNK